MYISSYLNVFSCLPRSCYASGNPQAARSIVYHQIFLLLLLRTHPLLVLLPLAPDIPKASPALALPTDAAIETKKCIWVAFAQNLLAFSCVLALTMPALPRDLTRPLGILDRLQLVGRYYDSGGENEDAHKELEGDVEGKRGVGEGCGVFVCRIDAGVDVRFNVLMMIAAIAQGMRVNLRMCEEQCAHGVEHRAEECHRGVFKELSYDDSNV